MGKEVFISSLSTPTYHWTNTAIQSLNIYTAVDLACDELVVDDFTLTVKNASAVSIPKGTPIYYVVDGTTNKLFYANSVKRVDKDSWEINGVSAVGLLEDMQYLGGKFSAGTDTFSSVLASIMNGTNITYQILDATLGVQPIEGWLPISSKREALHSLLMALNANLTKDANGGIVISYLYDYAGTNVPDSRIQLNGTVNYDAPASEVQVTEHTFMVTDNDEEVVLYDSSVEGTANNTFVQFTSSPIHSLDYPSTMTVSASNCNYAIVSGTGQLKGKIYTHSTRVIKRTNSSAPTQNVKQITGNTLINTLNSQNVLNKLYAYYTTSVTVDASIYPQGESAGRKIAFNNPFGEATSGFITSMDLNVDGDELADCHIVTGYVPTGQGNNFSHAQLIDSGSSFTIPSSSMRAILIGGGQGGQGGYDGESATVTRYTGESRPRISSYGTGGSGGNAGNGGNGGKVKVLDLTGLTQGTTATISLGNGGSGGAKNGGNGSNGTDTTMTIGSTTYSSATGETTASGFINIFNGQIYGKQGVNGVKGGKGGGYENSTFVNPEYVSYKSTTYVGGDSFDDWSYYTSGLGGWGSTGAGSGACAGKNGAMGNDETANGGNGVTPDAPLQALYGCGGEGGSGGSGGGTNSVGNYSYGTTYWWQEGYVGTGGNGSVGGVGGAGCILLYY